MLDFAPNMRFRTRIESIYLQLKRDKLNRNGNTFSTFDFRSLYCFGITNNRREEIYISSNIPNASMLAEYLARNHDLNTSTRRVGNPAQRHWLALTQEFRLSSPTLCSKICLLTALTLNRRINFQDLNL